MVKQTGIDKDKSADVYGLSGQRFLPGEEWMRNLMWKDDETVIAKSINNAVLFLTHHRDMEGTFVYNEFSDEIVLNKRPMWIKPRRNFEIGQRIKDEDITHATTWLERHGVQIPLNTARSAIVAAAKENTINPPKDYLEKLVWDGTKRLDMWLIDICGVKDTAYERLVGSKWMIAAIARMFRPGSKVDNILILEGDQGLGKSTLLKELCTFDDKPYFTDDLAPIGTKDCSIQLQGVMVVELPEMQVLMRTDMNVFKPWLSRTVDRYRPPYGILLTDSPRRCIFAGTWNPDGTGLFDDPTGSRRFWPVTCTEIDMVALRGCRDQLWAEAIVRYKAGEQWWLADDEAITWARAEQELREAEDTWAEKINEVTAGMTQTTIGLLLTELNIPMEKRDRRCERRVGNHMRRMGWIKKKKRLRSYGQPTWVFVHPDFQHIEEL